ncbi:MAG: phage holin family protein [Cyclobacteriaceae bacterium]|nr:phage holin family protein [Cyclobacteriaceae bacterium]
MINSEKGNSEKWVDSVTELVESYRDLISIRIVEHTTRGASLSVIGLLSLLVAVFVLLFAGLGSAWWLGEAMDNMKAGFFIVGGFYLVVFGILLATSKTVLIPWIRNLIIKKIYEQD